MSIRAFARAITPPALLDVVRHHVLPRRGLYFTGCPRNWDEARRMSTGYDIDLILERVTLATRAVLAGGARYERDSVLFDEPDYAFPLLSILLRAALGRNGSLTVLDFGGSLGSSYRQCRPMLQEVEQLRWHVVEQPSFVRAGLEEFATDELRFRGSIDEVLADDTPDVALACSVLQYVESPDLVLAQLTATGARFVVIERTPLTTDDAHTLCIQHVPAEIYQATYPCWLLSRSRLLASLPLDWRIVSEYPELPGPWATDDGRGFELGGLILERR